MGTFQGHLGINGSRPSHLRCQASPATLELSSILLHGDHVHTLAGDTDDIRARPSADNQSTLPRGTKHRSQVASHVGVLLGGVDQLLGSRHGRLASNAMGVQVVVSKYRVIACKVEGRARRSTGSISNKDHLDGKDEAIGATLILVWFIHIEWVDIIPTTLLHGCLDATSIRVMNNEGNCSIITKIDDRQLLKEHVELAIRQQFIPRGQSQTEWHVPEDETCMSNNKQYTSLILIS